MLLVHVWLVSEFCMLIKKLSSIFINFNLPPPGISNQNIRSDQFRYGHIMVCPSCSYSLDCELCPAVIAFIAFPNFFRHVLPQLCPPTHGKWYEVLCRTRPPFRVDQDWKSCHTPCFPGSVSQLTSNVEILGVELDRLVVLTKVIGHIAQVAIRTAFPSPQSDKPRMGLLC